MGRRGKGEMLTTVWTPEAARLRTAVSTAVERDSKPRDMEATEATKPLALWRDECCEAT